MAVAPQQPAGSRALAADDTEPVGRQPVHAALPDLLAVFCSRGDGPRGGVDARRHPLEGGDQQAGSKDRRRRSEEHTSELQSLMRISYAVFCLKKKKNIPMNTQRDTFTHTRTKHY